VKQPISPEQLLDMAPLDRGLLDISAESVGTSAILAPDQVAPQIPVVAKRGRKKIILESDTPWLATNSYQDRTRQELQAQLDNPPPGQVLKLTPQEYPGPLFIRKSVIIDGQGATLWAFKGPVLQINAPRVILHNLNIEVTGETFASPTEECAIEIANTATIHFDNVQVRGQVTGLAGETGEWQYPYSLHLGQLAANTVQQFILRIVVPTPCSIESAISGVQLTPTLLEAGIREIQMEIDPLRHDISLYGSLYLKTAQLKRRIHLTAHISSAVSPQPQLSPLVLWSPPNRSSPPPWLQPDIDTQPQEETVSLIKQQDSRAKPLRQTESLRDNQNIFKQSSLATRPVVSNNPSSQKSVFLKERAKDNQAKKVVEQVESVVKGDKEQSDNVFLRGRREK
jgi:hypothetical protein